MLCETPVLVSHKLCHVSLCHQGRQTRDVSCVHLVNYSETFTFKTTRPWEPHRRGVGTCGPTLRWCPSGARWCSQELGEMLC